MYVCHCSGVSDRAVRAAVAAGNRTVDDLAESCGAGTGCGGCHPLLAELLGCSDHELVTVGASAAA